MTPPPTVRAEARTVRAILVGNPNSGKSSLFNALTGLRQKVGNYPGVTVERRSGWFRLSDGTTVELLDLPGMYSLNPKSLDEQIAYETAIGASPEEPVLPDLALIIVDASNLERNLYLATQVLDLQIPAVIALNMLDVAASKGIKVYPQVLQERLGVPVVPIRADKGRGIAELRRAIEELLRQSRPAPSQWRPPEPVEAACRQIDREWFDPYTALDERVHVAESLRVLTDDHALERWARRPQGERLRALVHQARAVLEQAGLDWRSVEAAYRYRWLEELAQAATERVRTVSETITDRLDRVLVHPFWGPVLFVALLALIFQAIFSWAEYPMQGIEALVGWAQERARAHLPGPWLASLVADGILAGFGAVVTFLPQIMVLFFFIGLLEDSGYMARAAFIMDRFMSRLGLHGRSVVPLMSGFACAIPAIMATRTIENWRDRLITILVVPLMSCSARLPVYTLMIGAFIPEKRIAGLFSAAGLTLLGIYLLGIVMALLAAWIMKRLIAREQAPVFILELPPYKLPSLKHVLWQMGDRAQAFVVQAGPIIVAISILLWFLASFPVSEELQQRYAQLKAQAPTEEARLNLERQQAAEQLEQSFAGRLGRLIEPVIEPLGFDWKIGIALITSFAAREVFVSTMATIYSVGEADENSLTLRQQLREAQDPATGLPAYDWLVGLCVMVFFALACQCMSTVAVVRRETGSWKWPLLLLLYMNVLAYVVTLLVYQIGRVLGA
ncbi:MAG: ferrous iron transport protein B [Bacteroidota bacterium]|nr:ferrous iron transport protein B [Rhodothermia bacterium]MCS7154275.1 ferrous iron transport protein B [Bacteroidota bacterium]MDW8137031.1 ferrous iron transport protein B [Bacteroidota bacterium]MDW8285098.1 ferrous iron transport protein B [Bacteroidota bacterium]